MTDLTPITFAETDIDQIAGQAGRIAVTIDAEGRLSPGAKRVNKLTRGALVRLVESDKFQKLKEGTAISMGFPTGLAAEAVDVVRLERNAPVADARRAGAALAKLRGEADLLLLAGGLRRVSELAFGLAMRDYSFEDHKSVAKKQRKGTATIMCSKPADATAAAAP